MYSSDGRIMGNRLEERNPIVFLRALSLLRFLNPVGGCLYTC